MTVRGEIAKPRRETVRQAHRPEPSRRTGARSPEDLRPTVQYVEGLRGEPAGLLQQRIGDCSRRVLNNAG